MILPKNVRPRKPGSVLWRNRSGKASSRKKKRRNAGTPRRKKLRKKKPSWLLNVLRLRRPVSANDNCSFS